MRYRSVATAMFVTVTMVGAACGSDDASESKQTNPPAEPTTTTTPAPPPPPYYCNAVGTGVPPSGHGNGNHVSDIYAGMTKGPLDDADCAALTAQWDGVIAATKQYATRADAEGAGWRAAADYVVGLGTHHVKGDNIIPSATDPDVEFDATKPDFLIFGGYEPDAPLMGVAYTYLGPGVPSEGYVGANDWWHEHTTICMGGVDKILAGAESISDEACRELGGFNVKLTGPGGIFGEDNHFYMLHVWLPPYEYRPDVFVSGHPCLLERGLAPESDPCWEQSQRDPSLGAPPGSTSHHH